MRTAQTLQQSSICQVTLCACFVECGSIRSVLHGFQFRSSRCEHSELWQDTLTTKILFSVSASARLSHSQAIESYISCKFSPRSKFKKHHNYHECIPVGCAPPALYRTGGSPWQRPPPLDRDPLDGDPPWTETETPLCEQNDTHE